MQCTALSAANLRTWKLFLRCWLPALNQMPQVRGHHAQPRHTACRLQPDPLRKLALSFKPIDGGHAVRHDGQQLGSQNERRLDMSDTRQGLWHAPPCPRSPHDCCGVLWDFVATFPQPDRTASFHPLCSGCLRFERLGRSESPRYKGAFMRRSSLGGTVVTP